MSQMDDDFSYDDYIDSDLYLYCVICSKDITLDMGIEDDTCRRCRDTI